MLICNMKKNIPFQMIFVYGNLSDLPVMSIGPHDVLL